MEDITVYQFILAVGSVTAPILFSALVSPLVVEGIKKAVDDYTPMKWVEKSAHTLNLVIAVFLACGVKASIAASVNVDWYFNVWYMYVVTGVVSSLGAKMLYHRFYKPWFSKNDVDKQA